MTKENIKKFLKLSNAVGLYYSIIMTATFSVIFNFDISLEKIGVNFLLFYSFGLIFIVAMLLLYGKYVLDFAEANLKFIFRKYNDATEQYNLVIVYLNNYEPIFFLRKKLKKISLRITYEKLANCYHKMNNIKQVENNIQLAARFTDLNKQQMYIKKQYKKFKIKETIILSN